MRAGTDGAGLATTSYAARSSHAADHLSLYQLTIEDGTPFAALHAAGALAVPDGEQAERASICLTQELCEAAGLPAYEVSNHARPGAESRHNLLYWRGHDYAGVGPGAHSRITMTAPSARCRRSKSPEAWLDAVEASAMASSSDESLSAAKLRRRISADGLAPRRRHRRDAARSHRWAASSTRRGCNSSRRKAWSSERPAGCGDRQRPPRARPADRRARRLTQYDAEVKVFGAGSITCGPYSRTSRMARPRSRCAVGQQPEQPVDAGKAASPRQRRRRVALPRRIWRQRHGEAHRVIAEACDARRRRAIGLGVFARRNRSSLSGRAPGTSRRPAPSPCRYWDSPIARCRGIAGPCW